MNKDRYQKICDHNSELLKTFLVLMARAMEEEFGITIMMVNHMIFLHPENPDIRSSTIAMGEKEMLKGMSQQLNKDIETKIEEFNKQPVFDCPVKIKKPFLN